MKKTECLVTNKFAHVVTKFAQGLRYVIDVKHY